jgi:DNA-binding NarL/FixJ family response regulator
MARVVAYVPDLMDRSKVAAAGDVTFVASPAQIAAEAESQQAEVVVVDVMRPGAIEAIAAVGPTARVIGFGRHTSPELLAAAKDAGASEALPRSAFFPRIDELLAGG